MLVIQAGLRAWHALAPAQEMLPAAPPARKGPDFDRSIAGEEDPGAGLELPQETANDGPASGGRGAGWARCPACAGEGTDPDGRRCSTCGGTGGIAESARGGSGHA